MHSFSVISPNVAINHTLLITRSYFCATFLTQSEDSVGIFNHVDVIGHKATELGHITSNNRHYAVNGHSRSPISVPFESSYAFSY